MKRGVIFEYLSEGNKCGMNPVSCPNIKGYRLIVFILIQSK